MVKQSITNIAEELTGEGSNVTRAEFLTEMQRMHPTNQQIFAGLVLSWMKDYAENYDADARNKYSIQEIKDIIESYKQTHDGEEFRSGFPLI